MCAGKVGVAATVNFAYVIKINLMVLCFAAYNLKDNSVESLVVVFI